MMAILPKTNSKFAPENWPSQKENDRLPTINFQGLVVSFRECTLGNQ